MSTAISSPPVLAGAWPMLRAMVGVGILCGLLIVSVYEWTLPIIERNRAEALERAIFELLPAATSSRSFRFTAEGRFSSELGASTEAGRVHAAYAADGRLAGFAVEAGGMGYQDVIRVLYGYSAERQAIIGLRVLESRETPGLGDKIETHADFRENFRELDVALDPTGSALLHPIEFTRNGEKQHPWQVDGITGATISSRAIAAILAESSARLVPGIRRQLGDFEWRDGDVVEPESE